MAASAQSLGEKLGRGIMRYRSGLIIGGLLGLVTGGLTGMLLGAVVAVLLSHALYHFLTGGVPPQETFFRATFAVMGKIAKADGRVSETEIQFAQHVMSRMELSEERRKKAIAYFTEGKADTFEIAEVLGPLSRVIQARADVKIMFVEIQLQAAMADGEISPAELAIIQQVCGLLRMSGPEMAALVERMEAQQAFYRQSHHQHQHYSPADEARLLKEAYGVLGVTESASDADIKKAYRKLMSQHHPDKLVAKGLPPEMMQLAKEKTQELQAAYDRIKAARKN